MTIGILEVTFAEKIRQRRKELKLSVKRLAEISGIPRGTVDGYEVGKRDPSAENIFKLATALQIDVNEFAECTSSVVEYKGVSQKKKRRK